MKYANIDDIKEGDKLIPDGGFDCLKEGQAVKVFRTEKGDLAVPCSAGRHLLDGQIDDERGILVGLAKPEK